MRSSVVALLWVLFASPPAAAASLDVRARTVITAEVRAEGERLKFDIAIRDDLDAVVEGAALFVSVRGSASIRLRSDASGQATGELALVSPGGSQAAMQESVRWTVRFEGDSRYGPSTTTGRFYPTRRPTRIVTTLSPQDAVRYGEHVRLYMRLEGDNGPIPHRAVTCDVGDDRRLQGRVNAQGEAVFVFDPVRLGGLGPQQIALEFSGDEVHAPATRMVSIQVHEPTRLTLHVGREGSGEAARLRFSGRLSDSSGALSDQPVAVVGDGEGDGEEVTYAVTKTGAQGQFIASIPSRMLQSKTGESLTIRATFLPTTQRHAASVSASASLLMPALPGVPLKWYAAVLLGMSFLILLFLGLRYREAFAVLRSGRSRGAGGFRPVETRHASRPLVSGALAEARRRSDWLSGVVKEHEGPQVARRAHITVTSIADGAVFETHGDGDGRFELGPLPDGHYALELDARGFLSRTATVSVPHDGSLDGCVYLLGSLRGVLRDVLMNALSPVLGALTWGRDTPREMARTLLASEHPRRDELSDLTELVEQAWFSADGPTAESLERASHLVGGQEESE